MNWWLGHNFDKKRPHLLQRMHMIRAIRRFFDDQDFYEVETPALQVCPVMDCHIHGFATALENLEGEHERMLYLHTSPEFAMKKLLVAGVPRLYQICHVFRNRESSRLHSPEFTMLEWYRAESSDYHAIMNDCQALLRHCAQALDITHYRHRGIACDPFAEWDIIAVRQAFADYAGLDLDLFLEDKDAFRSALDAQGIRTAADDGWDDLFFRVMAEKIEPYLGHERPAILYDYPACMASLSRKKLDDPCYAERFELYVCGLELANAFTELTDPVEQRARYEQEMAAKEALYGTRYPLDEDFIKALEHGLPDSGGIALGIDRLAMLASDAKDIEQVLWTGRI